ncbi:MAG: hypothetical protein CM1200mP2_52800 [Planctomycetaceae bacterium]|nr:MAG: hypothetical protein CM1200mP2_52800 [Planctomycetaceae bacterium]
MCDFKLASGGNSGVFLRTPVSPKNPAVDCYELNICDSHPAFQTASLVARKKGPAGLKVEGDWHTFHVVVEGRKLSVTLDGKPVLEFIDETASPLVAGRMGPPDEWGGDRIPERVRAPFGSETSVQRKRPEGVAGRGLEGRAGSPSSMERFTSKTGQGSLSRSRPGETLFFRLRRGQMVRVE